MYKLRVKDGQTSTVLLDDGSSMFTSKRSAKVTRFKANSSEVDTFPRTNHHASSLTCKKQHMSHFRKAVSWNFKVQHVWYLITFGKNGVNALDVPR